MATLKICETTIPGHSNLARMLWENRDQADRARPLTLTYADLVEALSLDAMKLAKREGWRLIPPSEASPTPEASSPPRGMTAEQAVMQVTEDAFPLAKLTAAECFENLRAVTEEYNRALRSMGPLADPAPTVEATDQLAKTVVRPELRESPPEVQRLSDGEADALTRVMGGGL